MNIFEYIKNILKSLTEEQILVVVAIAVIIIQVFVYTILELIKEKY